jgi:uncharacterized protein YbjT (DUF2867 family)
MAGGIPDFQDDQKSKLDSHHIESKMIGLPTILVTGVTGYIGGRLVPCLLKEEYRVRVLVRDLTRLKGRPWLKQVELSEGDAFQPETLIKAMRQVDVAYYFIHSLYTGSEFHQRDLTAARNFGSAAVESGVKRIIYLGGLGDPRSRLSEHLRSRQLTGDALRQAGVPVTEFRAAVIVGSGSASFEMIRYLTERIPLMICPRWVFSRIQPIAISDVMDYLIAAVNTPESADKIIEIGGADVLTYAATMLEYARIRGLRRFVIPVPVLTPGLSSHWVHWVTPVSAKIARPLIEGLRNQVVVTDDSAQRLFPDIRPMRYESAVRLALSNLRAGSVETAWSDALITSLGKVSPVKLNIKEGLMLMSQQRIVRGSTDEIFGILTSLGGERGWLFANGAWRLRGIADRFLGGVGLRRGRRHPRELRVGDVVDFWRVEAIEPSRVLTLRSEMKAPGNIWLQFQTRPHQMESVLLNQTLFYAPRGLLGLLYWYIFYPLHKLIFSGLISRLVAQSEES